MEPARTTLRRLPLAQLAALAVVCGVTGLVFHRAFTTSALLGPVIGAAATPAILAALIRLRWEDPAPSTAIVLAFAGYVVFAGAALFGGLPTPDTLSSIGDGLGNGWARLLSTTLPVDSGPSMLLVPTTAVWIASTVGAELVLRTRSALAPLLPPTLALIAGVIFGVGGEGSNTVVVGAFVALAALFLALRSSAPRLIEATDDRSRAKARRRIVVSLPALAMIAILAAAIGPQVPGAGAREPFDLRAYRHDPIAPRRAANPLDLLKARLSRADRVEFTVDANAPENWRLVVLDRFDGTTWSQRGRFNRIGTAVPKVDSGSHPTASVEQHYRVRHLDGFFVPAATSASRISVGDFGYSPTTGVLVTGRNSVRNLRYDVTSLVPRLPKVDLRTVLASRGRRFRAFRELPGEVPTAITTAASKVVIGGYDFQKMARLQQYLRDSKLFKYSLKAPTGHSYGHLQYFLTDPAGKRGTAEQFATAFAVLARAAGFPTRVVVGFRPGSDSGRRGHYIVRGSEAHAWPEVHFDGLGWIAFDPTPADPTNAGSKVEPSSSSVIEHATDQAAAEPEQTPPPNPRGDRPGGTRTSTNDGSGGQSLLLAIVIALVAVALVGITGLLVMKHRRRRARRFAPTPRARVVGAWEEVLERLADSGVGSTRSMTTNDVAHKAAEVAGREGAEPLAPLGALVNVALYSPETPAEPDARAAWVHTDAFVVSLVRRQSIPDRLKAALDLRALRPRRR